MKKIISVICAVVAISSCMSQTDWMEEWLGNSKTSDKLSNLEAAIGFERVDLSWTNPTGPVAKNILVEYSSYGEEVQRKTINEMIDHVTIDKLTSDYGYNISVYTLDANGVKSLPVSMDCTPFTQRAKQLLVEDLSVGYYRIGKGYSLRWVFPAAMEYGGKITYTLSDGDGFILNGTQDIGEEEIANGKITAFHTDIIPELVEGKTFTVTTTVSAYPTNDDVVCIDEIVLEKTVSFEVIAPLYQIAFNTGTGATSIEGQLLSPDEQVIKPEDPTHPNKIFVGWRTALQSRFGQYYDFDTKVNQSLTLYAVWVPKSLPKEFLPEMVEVKGGAFTMGDSWNASPAKGEFPLHEVTVNSFLMEKTETTQDIFEYVMNEYNPSAIVTNDPLFLGAKMPVNKISWFEAIVFCNVLSNVCGLEPCYSLNGETDATKWGNIPTVKDGWNNIKCDISKSGYRLPTEAEWEFACGGGARPNRDKYAGTNHDDELYKYAWCASEAEETIHIGALKRENTLNLYDLSGNVMEWCYDAWYSYTEDSQNNPVMENESVYKHVTRGGSWKWNNDSFCRTSWRDGNNSHYRSADVGFRMVRSL